MVLPLKVEHLDGAALLPPLLDDDGEGDGVVAGTPGGPEAGAGDRRASPALLVGAEEGDGLARLGGDDGERHAAIVGQRR